MEITISSDIKKIVDDAVTISGARGKFYVGVEHLFEALLSHPELLPPELTRDDRIRNLQLVAQETQREDWRGAVDVQPGEVFHTARCAGVLSQATKLAERLKAPQAGAAHLLLAILADAHATPSRAMDRLGMDRGSYVNQLRNLLSSQGEPLAPKSAASPRKTVIAADGEEAQSAARPDALESLTRDLTDLARRDKLGPAIGREEETMTLLEVLARQSKNNAILVGEAGVGKTRVVEGLARSIVNNSAAGILRDCRILELNIAALMAGTQYRGAFEERLMGLLEKLKADPGTILFIDEIHLIMGAGATDGDSLDAANLLKPALARGEIRCIGATTLQEYRRFVERDPAIERRFQPVRVEPLSAEATRQVLKALAPSLMKHHRVRISGRAIAAAVSLSERYITNRHLPDKAIDVLDQACARFRLKAMAAGSGPGSTALPFADGEGKVTPHDVRKVISQMTAIPVETMTAEERLMLIDLERRLKECIIGQDRAVSKVASLVKRSRVGLADPNRPDAVMLFLGPTGVGKTQLAKELAKQIFGAAEHLITFDMSEYMEEHSVSKLLGAPPGYQGSEEEGRLVKAVTDTPFSILLFDEIEKAHPRVFDLFLPILEEGRLQDSHGRKVSFKNCIIIFTSNIGAKCLSERPDAESSGELLEELRGHFRPEFINRIDDIVPFFPLIFEDIRSILRLHITELQTRLKPKGIGIRMYQRAYERLASEGYSADMGARELRRTVDRLVLDPISEMLLHNKFQKGDVVDILIDESAELCFRRGEPPKRTNERP